MKKLFMIGAASVALSAVAHAGSSFGVTSGVGYGLAGVNFETTVGVHSTLEAGVSYGGEFISFVVGSKYFPGQDHRDLFIGSRSAFLVMPGAVGSAGIFTGGYRWNLGTVNLDVEGGFAYGTVTDGYYYDRRLYPAFGLSAGYRF